MEEDYLTLDKEYLEAFNIGYTLSKETGLRAETIDKLKPEQLAKLNIGNNRLEVIKQGMKQYTKDIEKGYTKGKTNKVEIKEPSKALTKDKDFQAAFDKIKKEREENERNKNRDKGISR
tara:strand:- start:35 stop:391 length:357 start_codon:yes stop_codon:yes gene_type:complete